MDKSVVRLTYTDMHAAGEPVRIVTGGYPEPEGRGILEKRRAARERFDHFRRALMREPRGHPGMYGVIPVASSDPSAAFGVLFIHNEGYSTMCGHATIALGRYAVERGLVEPREPLTRFVVEAPCGPLRLAVEVVAGKVGRVSFESVPAFVEARDLVVEVPDLGRVVTDIAYGGAYYAILPASRLGFDFFATEVERLVAAAGALTERLRAVHPVRHPDEPDLGFLYGTILTDDAPAMAESWNLCVFADRQIDRSPTGSGVTARLALDLAKGLTRPGQSRLFRGLSGEPFDGRVVHASPRGAVVEVGGRAHYSGAGEFVLEPDDPFAWGFVLARRFGDVANGRD